MQSANWFCLHLLEASQVYFEIGLHMTQEVIELLEQQNKILESNFYLEKALKIYYETEDVETCLSLINKSLKLNPNNQMALLQKADHYRLMGASMYKGLEKGEIYKKKSREIFDSFTNDHPNYFRVQVLASFYTIHFGLDYDQEVKEIYSQ